VSTKHVGSLIKIIFYIYILLVDTELEGGNVLCQILTDKCIEWQKSRCVYWVKSVNKH